MIKEVALSLDDEISKEHDMLEPQEPPHMNISHKRNPSWAHDIIQEEERYGSLECSSRESKNPKPLPSYVALMCDIVDKEPTCFEVFAKIK